MAPRFGYFGVKLLIDGCTMADDGSILQEEKEEAEEAVNESLPDWVARLAVPALVVQALSLNRPAYLSTYTVHPTIIGEILNKYTVTIVYYSDIVVAYRSK